MLGNVVFYFILFYFTRCAAPYNIKLIQISTSALAGTDHRDKLQKRQITIHAQKKINWLSPNCQQHDLKDKF
jgi:hypothetical protein